MQATHNVHASVQRGFELGQPVGGQDAAHRSYTNDDGASTQGSGLRRAVARQIQRHRGRRQRPLPHDIAAAPVAQAKSRLGV